jgi:hypothetical protein
MFSERLKNAIELTSAALCENDVSRRWETFCLSMARLLGGNTVASFRVQSFVGDRVGSYEHSQTYSFADFTGWADPNRAAPLQRYLGSDARTCNPIADALISQFVRANRRNFVTQRSEVVDSQTFESTAFFNDVFRPADIGQFAISSLPLGDMSMIRLVIHRPLGSSMPFDADELQMLHTCHAAVFNLTINRFFQTRPSQKQSLSELRRNPQFEPILTLLLTDLSEKQIAARLNRSFDSIHFKVKEAYRQLGVTSRAELLVLAFDPVRGHRITVDDHLTQSAAKADEFKRSTDEAVDRLRKKMSV